MLQNASDEPQEFKALGRRIGRRAKPKKGGAGKIVRRYVRGARFEQDAIDADGDGVVQENTQFARRVTRRPERPGRRVTLKPNTPSPTAAQNQPTSTRRRLRAVTIDEQSKVITSAVKRLTPKQAEAAWNLYNDHVDAKYGPIDTVDDAIKALQTGRTNIVELMDFLNNASGNDRLTGGQRGIVRGYLYALDNFNLDGFDISFKSGQGASTLVKSVDDNGKILPRPELIFEYDSDIDKGRIKIGDRYVQEIFAQGNIGSGMIDSVPNRVAMTYYDNPWQGNFGTHVYSKDDIATQIQQTLIAVHEGMHAVNERAMNKQVYGNLNATQAQKLLDDTVVQQGERLLEPRLVDYGLRPLAEIHQHYKIINELKRIQKQAGKGKTQQEKDELINTYSLGAISDENTLAAHIQAHRIAAESLEQPFLPGGKFEKHFKLMNDIKSRSTQPKFDITQYAERKNRAALMALGVDYINSGALDKETRTIRPFKKAIKPGDKVTPYLYRELATSLEKRISQEPNYIQELQQAANIVYAKDPFSDPAAEIRNSVYGPHTSEVIKYYQRVEGLPQTGIIDKDTYDRLLPNQIQPGADAVSPWKQRELSTAQAAITADRALKDRYVLDELNDREKEIAIKWMSQYSAYGSEIRHSYYNNSTLYQMVELPAELHGALLVSGGVGIPPAIRKLFTWHFSDAEYERITK